jgi:hypothetical protein
MERLIGLFVCGGLIYGLFGLWALGVALLVVGFKLWDARAPTPTSTRLKLGCFTVFFIVSCSACWLLYRR